MKTPNSIDSHWAWYSATGDQEILTKFITNFETTSGVCKKCIQWSFNSNYNNIEEVKMYWDRYYNKLTKEKQEYYYRHVFPTPEP